MLEPKSLWCVLDPYGRCRGIFTLQVAQRNYVSKVVHCLPSELTPFLSAIPVP